MSEPETLMGIEMAKNAVRQSSARIARIMVSNFHTVCLKIAASHVHNFVQGV